MRPGQDEHARYHRRLRKLKAAARRWTVLAAGLGSTTAVIVPYQGIGAWDAMWAGLTGASAVMAWWRWADLRTLAAQPAPDPPDPAAAGERWLSVLAQLPGGHQLAENLRRQRVRGGLRNSEAAEVWERFDRSARTMHELTGRLGGMDAEAAQEARGVERELRELTNRIVGLEEALKHAPGQARPALQELRVDHVAHLKAGVTAYEEFVVAAAGYLSESARTGEPVPAVGGLAHATDRLRGVTEGLAELRRMHRDLPTQG